MTDKTNENVKSRSLDKASSGVGVRPRTIQIHEGDGIRITRKNKWFNHKCCNCGLNHKITIKWEKDAVKLICN